MAPTAERIVEIYWDRKKARDPRVGKMLELLDAVEGRMVIPLPEMDRSERPMVANLIASGLDGHAQRIASTMPDVFCPPARVKQGGEDFTIHSRRAQDRRDAIRGWWSMNHLNLGMRKRARYYLGYASSPVVIRPRPPSSRREGGRMREIPYWHIRDPVTMLPPPGEDIDPPDCIFTFQRSWRWLQQTYPEAAGRVERPKDTGPDLLFDVIEYVDDEILSLVVLGRSADRLAIGNGAGAALNASYSMSRSSPGTRPFVEIERAENLAGICPAVVPGRISLGSEAQGHFDGLLGLFWWRSKLMALGGLAAERDVFPEHWLVANPGQNAQVVVAADGPRGIVGEIEGGDIKSTHAPPGAATMLMLDHLERSERIAGAVPAEMHGESATNIRTARRGAQVLSSAVDFPVQEAQEIFQVALEEENIRAVATVKAYYGNRPRSFYYQWNNRTAFTEYTPDETFDSDQNVVRYSFPGTNMNELVIGGGQRVGMETLSHRGFMEIDPMVEDPEKEMGRITAEGIRRALMQALQTGLASGQIPPSDGARILKLVNVNGKPLEEAIAQVQAEAQRRQASSGEPGTDEGPVPQGSPEAQPGLAVPGTGAEQPSIPEPAAGPANLSMLLANLRRPSGARAGVA